MDYAAQCAFADRLFRALAQTDGRCLLDLACGTGQHLGLMAPYGYNLSGLDNSPSMLAAAEVRCPSATLVCQDLASFDYHQRFDLITCFLYSIHYSHPVASLQRTLTLAWQALRPGGLLMFDMVDKAGIEQRDAVSRATQNGEQFVFRSGWRYSGVGEDLELLVSITRLADSSQGIDGAIWTDRHTMTAVSIPDVRAMMEAIGFEVTVFERDFDILSVWAGQSFNVVMAGKRPPA